MEPHRVMGASQGHGASRCHGSLTMPAHSILEGKAYMILLFPIISDYSGRPGLYGRKHALFRHYQIRNKTCHEENRRESHAFHPQIINKAHVLAQDPLGSILQAKATQWRLPTPQSAKRVSFDGYVSHFLADMLFRIL